MDAKCADGSTVILKRVRISEHPMEVEITQYLSSIADKKNHSPQLKDVLIVPDDDELRILVFPLLRRFDDPEFDTIGEAVDFFRQLFEVWKPSSILKSVEKLVMFLRVHNSFTISTLHIGMFTSARYLLNLTIRQRSWHSQYPNGHFHVS